MLSDEIESYAAYLNADADRYEDEDQRRLFVEDREKARQAMVVAWLEHQQEL